MPQSGKYSEDVLERFLDVLVQRITATKPEYLTSPFTVAEIYQDLVPYRSHRDLIGVEMNGDYEDALFRMLSGEGDFLVLGSDVAQREMQAELTSSNPNTALFREFAAVDVRLHPSRVPPVDSRGSDVRIEEAGAETKLESQVAPEPEVELAPEVEPAPNVEPAPEVVLEPELESEPDVKLETDAVLPSEVELEPERLTEDGVVGHIATAAASPVVSVGEPASDEAGSIDTDTEAETDTDTVEDVDVMTVCHWCREDLPVSGSIHFCPFCGSDLRPSPCRECGEAMEARWQFCVSCGADVRA